jgi:hypothetical protein
MLMRHARRRHARGPLNWCSENSHSDVTPHLAFCFRGIVICGTAQRGPETIISELPARHAAIASSKRDAFDLLELKPT